MIEAAKNDDRLRREKEGGSRIRSVSVIGADTTSSCFGALAMSCKQQGKRNSLPTTESFTLGHVSVLALEKGAG